MKTGILLMNTGTADEPTVVAIRNYLREFLMDPAIIGAPEFIRKRIVNHIVNTRPQKTLPNYEEFWTSEGSPFLIASNKQVKRLQLEMSARLVDDVQVALGMRYGNPSVLDGLHELRVGGCERVVVLPLYPQQVNVCSGTCFKKAHELLNKMGEQHGWHPEVVDVPYFYDQYNYRVALAKQIASVWRPVEGSKLVVSFHSTMLADIEKGGDPYREQVEATVSTLAADLRLPREDVVLCYQSRFDNRKWLQPFTEATVKKLAKQGVKDVAIVCPGFTTENMETQIEISRDLRKTYMDSAGRDANFTYVPCLNDNGHFIKALADAIMKALEGGFAPVEMSGITSDGSVLTRTRH